MERWKFTRKFKLEAVRLMTILGFDHFQITMPKGQEGTARAFYDDLLTLVEIPKPEALAKRRIVVLRRLAATTCQCRV
jgi:hypothetical protein